MVINRTITVPLIYNGEDARSYFKYTYKTTTQANGNTWKCNRKVHFNYTPRNCRYIYCYSKCNTWLEW